MQLPMKGLPFGRKQHCPLLFPYTSLSCSEDKNSKVRLTGMAVVSITWEKLVLANQQHHDVLNILKTFHADVFTKRKDR